VIPNDFEVLRLVDVLAVIKNLKLHVARHGEGWRIQGGDALYGSPYLVKGCIKSKNWAISPFYVGETSGKMLLNSSLLKIANFRHRLTMVIDAEISKGNCPNWS
jgi:hypothetical protein